jgi:hypothetical protein
MEVFADASPGLLATAAPTPSAMASAPTRPMYSGRPATPRRYVKLSHLVSDRDWTPVWFIDTRHPPVEYMCLAMRQITISRERGERLADVRTQLPLWVEQPPLQFFRRANVVGGPSERAHTAGIVGAHHAHSVVIGGPIFG